MLPNIAQAVGATSSVSQYRLGNRYTKVSSGRDSTVCSYARGDTGSARPLSPIKPSAVMQNRPGGATTRVHQLPYPSRYIDKGTAGSITMVSARTRSWLRV